MTDWLNRCHFGDCLETLRRMPDGIVNTCVTSPPYFGLRDYGHPDQIGLEPTPDEFAAKLVSVFREVRRVLRDDGTLWVNIGDSYNAYNGGAGPSSSLSRGAQTEQRPQLESGYGLKFKGLKPKDLIGIPWRLAFALQADGWWLRQDIIWAKPNPMPESVEDRCTKAHEYLFLLAKSERYYCDMGAIKEPAIYYGITGMDETGFKNAAEFNGKHAANPDIRGERSKRDSFKRDEAGAIHPGQTVANHRPDRAENEYDIGTRNKRSVWTIATKPYKGAHFATFPTDLIEPCVLAGAPAGGVVLDPFFGSGTTGQVAQALGRKWIGCELNPDYAPLQAERLRQPSLDLEAA